LVSNGLRTAEQALVISEGLPFGNALDPAWRCGEGGQSSERCQVLQALASVFAAYPDDPRAKLVLKLDLLGLTAIPLLRACWPRVPIAIVVRNPVEVIASNVAKPPEWLTFREHRPSQAFPWASGNLQRMSAEEFCARVVGQLCEAAVQSYDANTMVLDYQNINSQTLQQMAERFSLPQLDPVRLNAVLRVDAKDYGKRSFLAPRKEAVRIPKAIVEAAEKWVAAPYQRLREYERNTACNPPRLIYAN
jgi:hypothetical protein